MRGMLRLRSEERACGVVGSDIWQARAVGRHRPWRTVSRRSLSIARPLAGPERAHPGGNADSPNIDREPALPGRVLCLCVPQGRNSDRQPPLAGRCA